MPKRTAKLLLAYVVVIVVAGAAVSRWAIFAPYFGYQIASEAKGILETALLSTMAVWSTISSAKKRLRWASVSGTVFFVLAEHACFLPLFLGMRRWEFVLLGFLPGILGTFCGAYLVAGWFVFKRFSLRPVDQLSKETENYRIRFSIGELFVFTLVCAAIIGLARIASFELADDWRSRIRFMLAVALLGLPYGVTAGIAAWSILLSQSPWRRLPYCLALFAGIIWGIAYFLEGEAATADLASFLRFPLQLFAAQACVFWSLRSAGYRLVWRETAALGDNPAPAG